MSTIKSLWASVQGDPALMRRVNGWLTILDRDDPGVARVGLDPQRRVRVRLSLWALVSGHWSAWQAARVEVEQQRDFQEREAHPTEQHVVDELIKQTTIEPADSH